MLNESSLNTSMWKAAGNLPLCWFVIQMSERSFPTAYPCVCGMHIYLRCHVRGLFLAFAAVADLWTPPLCCGNEANVTQDVTSWTVDVSRVRLRYDVNPSDEPAPCCCPANHLAAFLVDYANTPQVLSNAFVRRLCMSQWDSTRRESVCTAS